MDQFHVSSDDVSSVLDALAAQFADEEVSNYFSISIYIMVLLQCHFVHISNMPQETGGNIEYVLTNRALIKTSIQLELRYFANSLAYQFFSLFSMDQFQMND